MDAPYVCFMTLLYHRSCESKPSEIISFFKLHLPQFGDFISDDRRLLKLERPGRVLHFFFSFFDIARHILQGFQFRKISRHLRIDFMINDRFDLFLDSFGGDMMPLIIFRLERPATIRLVNGALHRTGHAVSIKDDFAPHIARRPADSLDKRSFAP